MRALGALSTSPSTPVLPATRSPKPASLSRAATSRSRLSMGPAALGDFLAPGVAQATGMPTRGRSLDNTLRVVELVPTEWVLLDTHVDVVANGFGHGRINLWAEDGTLMAIASQTVTVRRRPP